MGARLAVGADLAACAPCHAAASCAVLAPVQGCQPPAGPSCQHGRTPGPTDHSHVIQQGKPRLLECLHMAALLGCPSVARR